MFRPHHLALSALGRDGEEETCRNIENFMSEGKL